jgi:hypothetical protein
MLRETRQAISPLWKLWTWIADARDVYVSRGTVRADSTLTIGQYIAHAIGWATIRGLIAPSLAPSSPRRWRLLAVMGSIASMLIRFDMSAHRLD